MVLVTPPGSCCFQLDELPGILLRSQQGVKYYVTPVAILSAEPLFFI